MNVYFDRKQKRFGLLSETKLVWGSNSLPLPVLPLSEHVDSYNMKVKNKKLGPVVGLLTSEHTEKPFAGNEETFKRIHQKLQEKGGLPVVFTPSGWEANAVKGYFYCAHTASWIQASFPRPDVIYNRVPTIKKEQKTEMQHFFSAISQENIPFFNPHFFTKWDTYCLLKGDEWLSQFLPETIHVSDEQPFQRFLEIEKTAFLKPIYGNKGAGIFKITLEESGSIVCLGNQYRSKFSTFPRLWKAVSQLISTTPYLLQRAIPLNTISNKPYDFRVHVQQLQGSWTLAGIGVRSAGEKSITTHVPKGGEILSTYQISPPINRQRFEAISYRVGDMLSKAYGEIGEFSLDIGRDTSGHLWLFEVNSKPMIFDEPFIQQQGLTNLIQLFYEKSKF
ncbi:YheC/YheD family protein [Bacillus alkalicellulosilyticus]|uniref:YheC/YheD family endospore coat-associated protein n=1 Tax=Alkalihalobacterium alkalicellulosilyticum TaxID=1912214 RepID=UPI000997A5A7|nr:YheC/YheD family protein [Bacillus alkalicellulosilyticus]